MSVNETIARVRVEWGAVKDQWNLRPKAASLGWEHLLKKKFLSTGPGNVGAL